MDGFPQAESIIQQSKEHGVDGIICVGGSLESSKLTKALSEAHPDYLFPALGVHPSNILETDIDAAISYLRENLDGCVAVGEIGLDYSYSFAKPEDIRSQMKNIYSQFLSLASEYNLPVSIHSRSAYKDSYELASEASVEGVFHWYDGPLHTLHDILDSGFYVSATPSVEYNKGARAVMRETPIERILVETDSPIYMRKFDRKSTPVDVNLVVEALAEVKEMDVSEVTHVTKCNCETVFRLP